MSTSPSDDLCVLLARWAAGEVAAVDPLVAACVPRLAALPGAAPAAQVEAATRRVLAQAPRFVVADPGRLLALLHRLVTQELAAGAEPARRESTRAAAAAPFLDLDRGVATADAAQHNAVLKLALLLLSQDDRKLLLGHWAGMDDAALAKRVGASAEDVAPRRARVVESHQHIARHLELGAVEEALRVGGLRAAADPWGMTTQWSMVLGAVAADDKSRVQVSWRRLVERYKDPIRRAIQRGIGGAAGSEDLVDEFFSYLFEHNVLAKVRPQAGKLRAYIQVVLRHFLHHRRRDQRAWQELDEANAPGASAADLAAERDDEAEWASHVLRLALAGLMRRAARDGDVLLRYYGIAWPDVDVARAPQSREEIAADLGITLAAVDQATYRARRTLRSCLERELRETVDNADDHASEVELVGKRLLEAYPGLL